MNGRNQIEPATRVSLMCSLLQKHLQPAGVVPSGGRKNVSPYIIIKQIIYFLALWDHWGHAESVLKLSYVEAGVRFVPRFHSAFNRLPRP